MTSEPTKKNCTEKISGKHFYNVLYLSKRKGMDIIMGSLLNRLLIMLNDSDPKSTDYHITFTLLMNFYLLSTLSIGEVAKLCTVSKSTISKFIRNIGYEDYADFKSAAPFKENKFGFDLNYNQNIAEYIESNGLEHYINILYNDLISAKSSIDMSKIEALAKDLLAYQKVISFGLLFSEIGAIDLQWKLAYNGKFIITNMSDIKQKDLLDRATEDTLIIIYSNSGSYIQKYQLSEFQEPKDFSHLKAKLVLITSNKKMTNYPGIDLCICYGHTSSVQTHSILYPLINDMIVMKYREFIRKKSRNKNLLFLVSKMRTFKGISKIML